MAVSISLPALTRLQTLFLLQVQDGHATLAAIRKSLNQNPYRKDVTRSAFYGVVDRLEENGLIKKSNEGRATSVELTALGEAKLDESLNFCRFLLA